MKTPGNLCQRYFLLVSAKDCLVGFFLKIDIWSTQFLFAKTSLFGLKLIRTKDGEVDAHFERSFEELAQLEPFMFFELPDAVGNAMFE